MKKNILTSLLLSITVFSSIDALAEEDIQAEPGAKLLVWTDPEAIEFMTSVTKDFAKLHNVSFDVNVQPAVGAITRVIQDGGNTRVADVFETVHNSLGKGVAAGVIMENLVSADKIKENFIQSALPASQSLMDGELLTFGFPLSFDTTAMYYNKDIFPEAPKSFEELLEKGPAITSPAENRYALLWDIQNYYESRMFLALFGGYEFGDEGTNPQDLGIATPEAIKGIEAMIALRSITAKSAADIANPQVRRGLFSEGKVGVIFDVPVATSIYDAENVNYGIAPLPTYHGKPMPNFATVRLGVVSTFTEYPKAAQLFADFLSSEEVMLKRYKTLGTIPVRKSAIEQVMKNTENLNTAFLSQGQHAQSMPSIPQMTYLWQPLQAALSDIWDKNTPVEATLQKTANTIMQQINSQK